MRAMIPALALTSAMLLSACGIKGPLFLAEPSQSSQSADKRGAAGNDSKPDFDSASIPNQKR